MSIVTDPADISNSNSALVYSDAPSNDAAIREIDRRATEHRFVRTRDYHLSVVSREGKTLYKSICYRWQPEDEAAAGEYVRTVEARRARLPKSLDSAEILRESGL